MTLALAIANPNPNPNPNPKSSGDSVAFQSPRASLHGFAALTDAQPTFVFIAKQLPTAFIEINQGDER